MEKFKTLTSKVCPVNYSNVDTDMIIPAQYLTSTSKQGYGENLFRRMRDEIKDFSLNQEKYESSEILIANDNFGCGSSREHAPWAIEDYGFNTIISTSFADIFYNNCFKNGILPIVVSADELKSLMAEVDANEGIKFTVDLDKQEVTTPGGLELKFEIDGFRKNNLLNGLDDIGLSLQQVDKIDAYEEKHKERFPWLWAS